jgi:glutamine synthetase
LKPEDIIAWDPTSSFIYGTTYVFLNCFISYTGEALDNKFHHYEHHLPWILLQQKCVKYFDKMLKVLAVTLGWEQEYFFLIDKSLADSRPDLIMTGRTLLDMYSAKGQQLDDHYFGSIPTRALTYKERDLEQARMLLGIPVKRVTMK